FELVAVDRAPQLGSLRGAPDHFRSYVPIQLEAISAGLFGAIHRSVRIANQAFGRRAVARSDRQTDTGGDVQLIGLEEVRLPKDPDDFLRRAQRVRFALDFRQEDDKLVAADARNGVAVTQTLLQTGGHLFEERVADAVPERVVHLFQFVEID